MSPASRLTTQRALWMAQGAMVTLVLCLVLLMPWGMWVGKRDVQLLHAAEREAAFALCDEQQAVAVRYAPDRLRPDRDVWLCFAGSSRLLRHLQPPLQHPLAAPARSAR